MALSSSYFVWKDIEKLKIEEQRRLLRWQLQAREPIHRFSDMKAGDHLVRKNAILGISYEHHFICIGFHYEGRPKIVHYHNTSANASIRMISTSVQVMTLPHKDFIKNENELQAEGREVERVVWPEELRRFSVGEVISRALEKKKDEFYHLIKNNCETFVMWCLCGFKISLQVTPRRKALLEIGSGILQSIRHGLQQIPKIVAELIDDLPRAIGRGAKRSAAGKAAPRAISELGGWIGAAVTAIVEVAMAGYDIRKAFKKWKNRKDNGLIDSREEFIKEVTDIVLLAFSRSLGSIGGMFIGQILIPIPVVGGLVGAVLGVFGGHLIGKLISATIAENLARFIETEIVQKLEKVTRCKSGTAVHTCSLLGLPEPILPHGSLP